MRRIARLRSRPNGRRCVLRPLRALAAAAWTLSVLAATPVRAGSEPDTGVLTMIYENDTFAGTDRYYTNGLMLAWRSAGAPSALSAVGRMVSPVLLPDGHVTWGIAVDQQIFTSSDTGKSQPDRDDHPYSGHLAGTFSLQSETPESVGTMDLSLGVIGPASGARWVQDTAHRLIDENRAHGWDHQISNRFAGLLTLERRWRFEATVLEEERFAVGIVPAVALNLGNVQTSAVVGLLARAGNGLGMDFGPPRIRPALSGLGSFHPPEGVAGYLFGSVDARAVAYDGAIDGNRDGYWQVERRWWVAEASAGVELAYGRSRLTFAYVARTRTFETQEDPLHRFGSMSFSFAF